MLWIRRLVTGVVVTVLVLFCLLWAFLALPPFQDVRRGLVERALSEQIGRAVIVQGDVRAVMSTQARVRVQGVVLPSETMSGQDLAKLAKLEFDVDVLTLLGGRIRLDNVVIDGLTVELLRAEDGTESWPTTNPPPAESDQAPEPDLAPEPDQRSTAHSDLLTFLANRTVSISDIHLRFSNAVTGFDFDFNLKSLLLEQIDSGRTLRVTGLGTVNDQPFRVDGSYPRGTRSQTSISLGPVGLTFDGTPGEGGTTFAGPLEIEVAEVGDLLEMLRLERELEGSARLKTTLTWQDGIVSVSGAAGEVLLDEGQRLAVSGGIGDLLGAKGVDVTIEARLHPEDAPPAPAVGLRDFKLRSISAQIVGDSSALELDDLLFTTNAFEQGLERIGPVSIGRVQRTPDGRLAMTGITIQAGPRDRPIVVAEGNIRDLLQLKDLDMAGRFDAPASLLLSRLQGVDADAFGRVQGAFSLDDTQGHLGINALNAKAVETAIWSLDADMSFSDPADLKGLSADIALGLADSASFLKALRLRPVDAGPLSVRAELLGSDADWRGEIGVKTAASAVTLSADGSARGKRNKIDAALTSNMIAIRDLRNVAEALVALAEIGNALPDKTKIPLQPLMLPRDEVVRPFAEEGDEGRPELQPLVLPRETAASEKPSQASADPDRPELQPLVLPKNNEPFDLETFVRETDLLARIDLQRITGVKGVTRVSSELVLNGGKARLGPLELRYGGGYFNFGAEMDVFDAPDRVRITGTTSDWDLSEILDLVGFAFEARGNLRATFNLTGRLTSVRDFVRSLSGSVSMSMTGGRIRTSLLELAGLGIFPWLFSEELRQGYTDLVCAKARLQANSGVISVKDLVAETRRVQLVARGWVNIVNDTLSLRVEPRRVGRPLSRSAWPFDVDGALSDPRFKLDVGGSRSRRVDGADEMPATRVPCRPDIYQLQ